MKQHNLLDKILTEDRLNKILNAITGMNSDGTVRGITTVESDSSDSNAGASLSRVLSAHSCK
jgi:hypothetical protein